MPVVPVNRSVEPIADPTPYAREQAHHFPGAFGRGLGYAIADVGKSVDSAASAAARIVIQEQAEDNERVAKDLDVEYMRQANALLYGKQGFYTKKGANAINSADATRKALGDIRNNLAKSAPNSDVAENFDRVSRYRVENELVNIGRYVSKERDTANTLASEARKMSAANEAALRWNDPLAVSQNLALIRNEVLGEAERTGADPAVTAELLRQETSLFYSNVIRSAMASDFEAGKKLADLHGGQLDAADQMKIKDLLDAEERHQLALADRADRQREEALRERREATYTRLITLSANPEGGQGAVSETDILEALQLGDISPAQYESLLQFNRDQLEDVTGPASEEAHLQFKARITDPDQAEPVSREDIMRDTRLSARQKESLLDDLSKASSDGSGPERADVKDNRKRIKEILGGEKDIFGNFTRAEDAERWVNANDDYNELVKGGTDPREASDKIIKRYRTQPSRLASLPNSRFWPGLRTEDRAMNETQLKAAEEAFLKAFSEGRMTGQEANEEMNILRRYRTVIESMANGSE